MITRKRVAELIHTRTAITAVADALRDPVVAYPDEPLRVVVTRMAETGRTRVPVIDQELHELLGMISLHDLLLARVRNLNEERNRERVLRLGLPFGGPARLPVTTDDGSAVNQ